MKVGSAKVLKEVRKVSEEVTFQPTFERQGRVNQTNGGGSEEVC